LKRIRLDIHVVLDVLLDRSPHANAGAAVWILVENGAVAGYLAGHAVTTIHDLARSVSEGFGTPYGIPNACTKRLLPKKKPPFRVA
jgi:hypothetical protein